MANPLQDLRPCPMLGHWRWMESGQSARFPTLAYTFFFLHEGRNLSISCYGGQQSFFSDESLLNVARLVETGPHSYAATSPSRAESSRAERYLGTRGLVPLGSPSTRMGRKCARLGLPAYEGGVPRVPVLCPPRTRGDCPGRCSVELPRGAGHDPTSLTVHSHFIELCIFYAKRVGNTPRQVPPTSA